MTDITTADFIIASLLALAAVAGFWVSRSQAKNLPGLMANNRTFG